MVAGELSSIPMFYYGFLRILKFSFFNLLVLIKEGEEGRGRRILNIEG